MYDHRPAPPARSHDQRLTALETANRIRIARARLKRRIKHDPSYRLLAAAIFHDTAELGLEPDELATMKVYELLMAGPKLGRVRVNRALARCGTSPSKTIAGLTNRQREDLVVELGIRRRQFTNRNYNRMLEETATR